ncbi:hypothetical protein LCGC14_0373910 [marine sediment metagenome]|uniref:Uncharacterized protein n=1 Tax=marine sediment metagenome TaxID=412755 RepID=A0A0F9TM53_9ZZZZ
MFISIERCKNCGCQIVKHQTGWNNPWLHNNGYTRLLRQPKHENKCKCGCVNPEPDLIKVRDSYKIRQEV